MRRVRLTRSRRWGLLSLVALSHLLVLWLLGRMAPTARLSPPTTISIIDGGMISEAIRQAAHARTYPRTESRAVADAAAAPEEPPPIAEAPPPDPAPGAPPAIDPTAEPTELDPEALADLLQRASVANLQNSSPGEAECGVADRLQQALLADPTAQAALTQAPASARSVANAISLWNGGWTSLGAPETQTALEPVRVRIRVEVTALPTHCRLQWIQGPRLVVLPNAAGATVLAFGSGRWRWADLLL